MRFADLFRRAPGTPPQVGDMAISETDDGLMIGEVTRTSGLATTIKWESGAQSINRIFTGGEIAIVATAQEGV